MVKTICKRLVILNAVFILLMTVYRTIFTVYYSGGLDFSIYLNDLFKAFFWDSDMILRSLHTLMPRLRYLL